MAGLRSLFGGSKAKDQGQGGQQGQQQGSQAQNNQQSQAVLNSNADDTKVEREQFINGKKQQIIDTAVDGAMKKLEEDLTSKIGKIVLASKPQILEAAKKEIEDQLKASHTGTETQHANVDANKLVAESDAWKDASAESAEQAKTLATPKKIELQNAANPAFVVDDKVSLKKKDREKHLKQATEKAKELVNAKAKEIATSLAVTLNNDQKKKDLVAAATAKAKGSVDQKAESEADKRNKADATIEDAVKDPIKAANDEINAATLLYLEKGLGAYGTGWFRSAEFKKFHASMKDHARTSGQNSTQAAIKDQRNGGNKQGAEFEYQTMQAQLQTHAAAKGELRGVMKDFAAELLGQAQGLYKVTDELHKPATTSAWAALRANPADDKNKAAAKKAAATAVKTAKPAIETAFHDKATKLKNDYVKVKGADGKEDEQGGKAKTDELNSNKVETHFGAGGKGEEFGKKMITKAMEAPSASKGLELVGKLIDAAAPQVGDSAELEIELKIPCTHGAFAYFTVKGEAARAKNMELGLTIGFGAGWEAVGISARGGFLVFLKSSAADTVTAMQLIHYGAFRNLTHVSDDMANFWAGAKDSKKTGKGDQQVGKNEQAELWAAMMEERTFGKDKDAYVEVGGGIAGKAKLNAGVGLGVEGSLTTARRWDREVFENIDKAGQQPPPQGQQAPAPTTKQLGTIGERTDAQGNLKSRADRKLMAQNKRKAIEQHVKRVQEFKMAASMDAEAGGVKFGIGIEGKWKSLEGWGFAAKASVPYDPQDTGSSGLTSKIAGAYVPAAMGGIKKIYDAYKAKHGNDQDKNNVEARGVGGTLDAGEDLLVGLDAGGMTHGLLKGLADANPQGMKAGTDEFTNDTARMWLGNHMGMGKVMGESGDMSKPVSDAPVAHPFGSTSTLEVELSVEQKPGEKPKFSFKVRKAKELRMGADLGGGVGLKGKLTRKSDLFGGQYQSGGSENGLFTGGRQEHAPPGGHGQQPHAPPQPQPQAPQQQVQQPQPQAPQQGGQQPQAPQLVAPPLLSQSMQQQQNNGNNNP